MSGASVRFTVDLARWCDHRIDWVAYSENASCDNDASRRCSRIYDA